MVAPKQMKPAPRECTDVAIIGGGVVGVIAAKRMQERDIDYKVLEKQRDFGGVWHTHGNNHSTLQVCCFCPLPVLGCWTSSMRSVALRGGKLAEFQNSGHVNT